jgi:hypothetical protein
MAPRKLKHERNVERLWVISPDLESETSLAEIKQTVAENPTKGTDYPKFVALRRPKKSTPLTLDEMAGD